VRGPAHDFIPHIRGAVDNPLNVLTRLLAGLQVANRKDPDPAFLRGGTGAHEEERAVISQAPINDDVGLHLTGVPRWAANRDILSRAVSVRPTLEIHGIAALYR